VPVLTKKTKEQQKTPKKQLNGNDLKTPKKDQITPKGQKTPMPKTPDANQTLINVNLLIVFYNLSYLC